jgi:hypothetical protein
VIYSPIPGELTIGLKYNPASHSTGLPQPKQDRLVGRPSFPQSRPLFTLLTLRVLRLGYLLYGDKKGDSEARIRAWYEGQLPG